MIKYIVNAGSVEDVLCYLKNKPPTKLQNVLREIEYERSHKNRLVVLKKLNAIYRKIDSTQIVHCVICGNQKPKREMRDVDTINGKPDGVWVWACRKSIKLGYEVACYTKYNRDRDLTLKNKFLSLVDWND